VGSGSPSRVTIAYDRGAASNDLAYTREDHVSRDTVAGRREPLMRQLATVYRDLGLPVNLLDPTGFAASTGSFSVQGRVGGVPADRYFNCGFTATGGSRAQSYGLTVTVTTQLAPAPAADSGSTLVMTGVSVFARQAGMSSNPVPCASTGALEKRIVAALRAAPGG
jgi:hypothetical protein